jgi:hypothetical protein
VDNLCPQNQLSSQWWSGFAIFDLRRPDAPIVAGQYDTLGAVNDFSARLPPEKSRICIRCAAWCWRADDKAIQISGGERHSYGTQSHGAGSRPKPNVANFVSLMAKNVHPWPRLHIGACLVWPAFQGGQS